MPPASTHVFGSFVRRVASPNRDDCPDPEAQYPRLVSVTKSLLAHCPGLSPEANVGHLELAPERKSDPGPRFDWRRLLLALIGPDQS